MNEPRQKRAGTGGVRRTPTAVVGALVLAGLAPFSFAAPEQDSGARGTGACSAETGGTSPLELYGDRVEFDVLRNGDRVGEHVTRFSEDRNLITATSEMHLEVDILFFTAYRFTYRSEDAWCGDELVSLTAEQVENGKRKTVQAVASGDELLIERPGDPRRVKAEPDVIPTNHWKFAAVDADRALNTLTGEVQRVDVEARGEELVETPAGPVPATRYVYTGALDTEVWYDQAGRWVKLQFKGQDGSTITYRCRRCGVDAATGGMRPAGTAASRARAPRWQRTNVSG